MRCRTPFSAPMADAILTAGSDYTLRLWDAASGSEIAAFVGHRHRVESMAFSPDGKRLLTRSSDWSARLWEVETGRQIALLRETDRQTNSAQFSPDRPAHRHRPVQQHSPHLGRRARQGASDPGRTQGHGGNGRVQPGRKTRGDRSSG